MQRVLVVGGGIAGNTAAIALAQRGVGCVIAEIQDSWDAAWMGIGLHSPPLRAAKALGLFEEIVRVGRPQPYLAMTRADGGLIAEILSLASHHSRHDYTWYHRRRYPQSLKPILFTLLHIGGLINRPVQIVGG